MCKVAGILELLTIKDGFSSCRAGNKLPTGENKCVVKYYKISTCRRYTNDTCFY